MSDGQSNEESGMYDRHDRPTGHHLLSDGPDAFRALAPEIGAALLEGAGRLSTVASGVAINAAIFFGALGRRLQQIAATPAVPEAPPWMVEPLRKAG